MSKIVSVGNVWVHAAATVKISMPATAKRGDAFLLAIDAGGDMALIGPVEPDANDALPVGMKHVCGITVESSIERIAVRLSQATTQ